MNRMTYRTSSVLTLRLKQLGTYHFNKTVL